MNKILEQFSNDSEYRSLITGFNEGHIPSVVSGMCDSARPFFVASVLKDVGKKGFVVVSEEKEARQIVEHLKLFFNRVFFYPARDFVFENVTAYSRDWEHERLSVQNAVISGDFDVIVTVPDALMQYVMPEAVLIENTVCLSYGESFSQKELCKKLDEMGYSRTDIVEGVGQFSIRGGIVDVFNGNYQVRVFSFGAITIH